MPERFSRSLMLKTFFTLFIVYEYLLNKCKLKYLINLKLLKMIALFLKKNKNNRKILCKTRAIAIETLLFAFNYMKVKKHLAIILS
jgi:hypothetical protein